MKKKFEQQVVFYQDKFDVDFQSQVFRHCRRSNQVIPFSAFVDNGKGMLQVRIRKSDAVLVEDWRSSPGQELVKVTVPARLLEGPVIAVPAVIEAMNIAARQGNFRLLDHMQRKRIEAGKLPLLTLMDADVWFFDGQRNEIRNSKFPFNRISLEFVDKTEDLKYHLLVYDTVTRTEGHLDCQAQVELPANYCMLKFPVREVFDPVGLARALGENDTAFLVKQPGLSQYQAKVIQWVKTAIPGIIARNRARQNLDALPAVGKSKTKRISRRQ